MGGTRTAAAAAAGGEGGNMETAPEPAATGGGDRAADAALAGAEGGVAAAIIVSFAQKRIVAGVAY